MKKPEIILPECPPDLLARGEEAKFVWRSQHNYNRPVYLISQKQNGRWLYTWIYEYEQIEENEEKRPGTMIVADMEKEIWLTYDVESETWGRSTIDTLFCQHDLIGERIDRDIYGISLEEMQREVLRVRRQRRNRSKNEDIKRTMAEVRELPEAFRAWAKRNMDPYIVYQPGHYHEGTCTRCGRTSTFKKKLAVKAARTCPHCRALCHCATPRTLPKITEDAFAYCQRIQDGMMARFITVVRDNTKWPEFVYEAEENLRIAVREEARQYWYERAWQYGKNGWERYWVRNQVHGVRHTANSPTIVYFLRMKHIGRGGEVKTYSKNLAGILRHTVLRYLPDLKNRVFDLKHEHGYRTEAYALIDMCEQFERYPAIETLYKTGFERLARELCANTQSTGISRAREPHKALGISKEMWRQLCREESRANIMFGDIKRLRRIEKSIPDKQKAYQIAEYFSEYNLTTLSEAGIDLGRAMSYMKQPREWSKYQYMDYIAMAQKLGYNLRDRFVAFPRDLMAAHDAAVEVQRERREAEDRAKRAKEYRKMEKVYQKIKKRFSWKDGNLLIRPVMSIAEIAEEGQTQHHCVNNGMYLSKILADESYILVLRRTEDPAQPYYTVEISPEGDVQQAFSKYNKKPDWETVKPFLDKFSERVKALNKVRRAANGKIDHAG